MRFCNAVRSFDNLALFHTVSRKGKLDDRTIWEAVLVSALCDNLSSMPSSDCTVLLKWAISIRASSLIDRRCSLKASRSDSKPWARLVRSSRIEVRPGPASSVLSSCTIEWRWCQGKKCRFAGTKVLGGCQALNSQLRDMSVNRCIQSESQEYQAGA